MKIVIRDPAGAARDIDLKPGTSFGRTGDNDVVLSDNQVSRQHARIVFDPEKGSAVIEDLKSRNGVFLNNRRIKESANLKAGDVIRIGESSIEVTKVFENVVRADTLSGETLITRLPRMVVLEKATKVYQLGKVEVQALKGLDLVVEEGEFISVCGPSGSGKSTLLNLIGCIDTPTSGRVSILGKDVTEFSDAALSKLRNNTIGFIFQSFNLIPVLTAFENVEYPLMLLNTPKSQRVEKVEAMFQEVGLTNFAKHKPEELSGGQRQRVAIARALVTSPKIVLADEPTANLDSKTGVEILDLMKKMNEEHSTTFIFSTHDPKIERYAKKIYTMADGVLVT